MLGVTSGDLVQFLIRQMSTGHFVCHSWISEYVILILWRHIYQYITDFRHVSAPFQNLDFNVQHECMLVGPVSYMRDSETRDIIYYGVRRQRNLVCHSQALSTDWQQQCSIKSALSSWALLSHSCHLSSSRICQSANIHQYRPLNTPLSFRLYLAAAVYKAAILLRRTVYSQASSYINQGKLAHIHPRRH
jgi:hypothetical protein